MPKKRISSKQQSSSTINVETFRCNVIDKLLKELLKHESWTHLIAQELECENREVEYKIIEKMKRIMDCHLKNNKIQIDQEGKHLIFPIFLDVASFLEEIHKSAMCDLNINELNYVSNINHPYKCSITLNHDNIFCDIEKKIKEEKEEQTVEQLIKDEEIKSKIFDKTEIDEEDPLKELLLKIDETVKELKSGPPSECNSPTANVKELKSEPASERNSPTANVEEFKSGPPSECNSPTANKKRRIDTDPEQNYFIENLQSLTFGGENYDSELLTNHLDDKLSKTITSDLQKFKENIPKIRNTFNVIFRFVLILEKTLEKIPTYVDPETKELKIRCEGCPIHCIGNWKFSKPVGRPSTSQNEHC